MKQISANSFLTAAIHDFLPIHINQAKKRQSKKVENFNKADKGESHAESKHPANVCNQSCSCHHLKQSKNQSFTQTQIRNTSSVRYLER